MLRFEMMDRWKVCIYFYEIAQTTVASSLLSLYIIKISDLQNTQIYLIPFHVEHLEKEKLSIFLFRVFTRLQKFSEGLKISFNCKEIRIRIYTNSSKLINISDFSNIWAASLKLARFNKLCKKAEGNNRRLMAKIYRAFEIDNVRIYDQLIDIWELSFAIAYTRFTKKRHQINVR